uniref:SJCHGC02045 protein n=1 Tax=Schistosoma japonicum TaxID=6182 RepID=Q5DG66_SCHJA|nr:SJCHGC02045 protein [Schistosoma japonicum]
MVSEFVPASYTSAEIWNARLSHDIFKKISARDHGLKILQKINVGQTVSPLDYDIFANKLDEMDVTFLDFIEEVITRFEVLLLIFLKLHEYPNCSNREGFDVSCVYSELFKLSRRRQIAKVIARKGINIRFFLLFSQKLGYLSILPLRFF